MAVGNLKKCPKCSGGLVIIRDKDGWYEECLSCGNRVDVSKLVTLTSVGQVKIKDPIDTAHTDVRSSPNN